MTLPAALRRARIPRRAARRHAAQLAAVGRSGRSVRDILAQADRLSTRLLGARS